MSPEHIAEVWNSLDREQLSEIANRGPSPVFATISGAHLYGFASPDSDVDLRGAYLLSARSLLGLHPSDETVTIVDKSVIDLDWVAHDLRKFARMMINHNGYALEQLYSPLRVVTSPVHDELMDLGRGCVTRPTVRHYLGFARGRRQRLLEPSPTVKHLLYAYRVLLSGIHLMRTGEVNSNLPSLNLEFRLPEIDELVERKRLGAEKMALDANDLAINGRLLDELEGQLHEAHATSSLPDEPQSVAALDDFVFRTRLKTIDGEFGHVSD